MGIYEPSKEFFIANRIKQDLENFDTDKSMAEVNRWVKARKREVNVVGKSDPKYWNYTRLEKLSQDLEILYMSNECRSNEGKLRFINLYMHIADRYGVKAGE